MHRAQRPPSDRLERQRSTQAALLKGLCVSRCDRCLAAYHLVAGHIYRIVGVGRDEAMQIAAFQAAALSRIIASMAT
jgi:hypothetical protein